MIAVVGEVALGLLLLFSAGCFVGAVYLVRLGTLLLLSLVHREDGRSRYTPWLHWRGRGAVADAEGFLRAALAQVAREEGAGR